LSKIAIHHNNVHKFSSAYEDVLAGAFRPGARCEGVQGIAEKVVSDDDRSAPGYTHNASHQADRCVLTEAVMLCQRGM
jgi:hypothetical protein